jgi:hypothetical protein
VRRDRELSIYPTNLLSIFLAFSVGCHVGVRLLGSIVVIWVRTQGVSPLQIAGAPRVSEVSLFGFPYFGGTIHHLAATSALKRPCLSRVYNPPCAPRRPPSRARERLGGYVRLTISERRELSSEKRLASIPHHRLRPQMRSLVPAVACLAGCFAQTGVLDPIPVPRLLRLTNRHLIPGPSLPARAPACP